MLNNMKIDDAALISYLVKHLQPLTEADPNLLAKYVAALLKNNKPKKELRTLCINKLFDFLGDGSETFVANLFRSLEDGTIAVIQNEDVPKTAVEDATTVQSATITKATLAGEAIEQKTLQSEKNSNASTAMFSDHDEEGTDDEDDDRNHKHRRRVSRSRSPDRETQEGHVSKRNRSIENGEPVYDNQQSMSETDRGSNDIYVDKDEPPKRRLPRDHVYGNSSRIAGEGSQRGASRGSSAFRGSEGLATRYEHQNGLSRGVLGRGRGSPSVSWGAREQRTASVDSSDFNMPMIPPGPLNLYPGRSNSSRGHSSWAGYGQFTGMTNGALDPTLPLNAGIQGSRGVPVTAALGMGVNMGMGLPLGRPRCPDFEERGYCLMGDLCPLEHGANRIVVEDVQSLSKFNLPVALPSGRGMGLGSISGSTSYGQYPVNSGLPSVTLHDTNMDDPTPSKASITNSANAEPDVYDPDQPLWNKEQSTAVTDGLRRLPSLRRGLDENERENIGAQRSLGISSDDRRYDRASTTAGSQGLTSGQSVWNRIGRIDRAEMKTESANRPANTSVLRSKVSRREILENPETESVLTKWDSVSNDKDDKLSVKTDVNTALDGETSNRQNEKTGYNPHARWNIGHGNNRAQKTLYVSYIPSSSNKKELLKAHFDKFGEIMDIRIPSQGDRAFIQFSKTEDAEAALKSPEAVMGNRFIRLSWAKRDSIPVFPSDGSSVLAVSGKPTATGNEAAHISAPDLKGKKQAPTGTSTFESSVMTGIGKAGASSVSLSVSSVPPKKQEELEHMKEELRKKQEELAQKREEFRRKLEQLTKQGTGVSTTTQSVKVDISAEQSSDKQVDSVKSVSALDDSSKADTLPATEKACEEINATVKDQSKVLPQISAAQPSPKGVRSHLPWPVVTSPAFTAYPPWGPMRYKLDNRTTTFRIVPPFPDGLCEVGAIKEHFSHFGDLTDVEMEEMDQKPIGFRVSFATRNSAEHAFIQGKWYQGTALQLSWVNPPTNTVSTPTGILESTDNKSTSKQTEIVSEESKTQNDGMQEKPKAHNMSTKDNSGFNDGLSEEDQKISAENNSQVNDSYLACEDSAGT